MATKVEKNTRRRSTSRKAKPKPPPKPDQVREYAESVCAGRIVTNKFVRLACERHLRDLKEGDGRGLVWDQAVAEKAIGYFSDVLVLAEGQHADQPFELELWQKFIVGSLFGWYRRRGSTCYRRFRTAYIEVGKGNGKSPLAAGIGLFGLTSDGERGAEIYSAATTKDQATICFRDAKRMVEASAALSECVEINVGNLYYPKTGSIMRPVSSEHRGLDGKRVHIGLVDELHEHPTSQVVDKIRAGTKGRRQAMIVEITNSGYDRHSVCYQHHEYSAKILEGIFSNDEWFAYICGLDEGDDWRNPEVWAKANPNLGVSVTHQYLEEQVREAEGMPAKQNIVRRLNFCEWTEQDERAIEMWLWDKSAGPVAQWLGAGLENLRGKPCYGGLDLAQVSDLSAFVLVFPQGTDTPWPVLPWFWVPQDDIETRSRRDRVPYDVWVRDGLMQVTPGNTTDYGFIQAKIVELAGLYNIREIAFDRAFSGQIIQNLTQELGEKRLIQFGQGFLSMASPTAEFLRRVKSCGFSHGGNPVLRWNASNLSLQKDPAGNLKPNKEKSCEKIDGIVALIMALGRAMVTPPPAQSIYEKQGYFFV